MVPLDVLGTVKVTEDVPNYRMPVVMACRMIFFSWGLCCAIEALPMGFGQVQNAYGQQYKRTRCTRNCDALGPHLPFRAAL